MDIFCRFHVVGIGTKVEGKIRQTLSRQIPRRIVVAGIDPELHHIIFTDNGCPCTNVVIGKEIPIPMDTVNHFRITGLGFCDKLSDHAVKHIQHFVIGCIRENVIVRKHLLSDTLEKILQLASVANLFAVGSSANARESLTISKAKGIRDSGSFSILGNYVSHLAILGSGEGTGEGFCRHAMILA